MAQTFFTSTVMTECEDNFNERNWRKRYEHAINNNNKIVTIEVKSMSARHLYHASGSANRFPSITPRAQITSASLWRLQVIRNIALDELFVDRDIRNICYDLIDGGYSDEYNDVIFNNFS